VWWVTLPRSLWWCSWQIESDSMEPNDDDKTRTHVVLTKGTMVSHYRIVEKIGAGGMGEVYLAEDTKLSRNVALKFLPTHLCRDEDSRTRFTREAKAAAKLDHPNIVPVYEVGEYNGRPFFAMAHITGEPLRDVVKQGKLSVAEAVSLTQQICEGLHEAHEAGVVHRDIKPGNIIIDSKGKPRLLDFGLATVSGEEKLTQTGSTLGTVGYMAPEQITGGKVDKRSDLFSVGVILYEMLTGRRPFEGDNDAAIIRAITTSTPEPIARFKSGVTGELQQVINKALAKDPALRYQHADGMLADLRRLTVETAPPRKNRFVWLASAAVVCVAGGYLISTLFTAGEESAQAQPPVLIVLPFVNLGAADDEYFSSGIREEISSRLSTIKELRLLSNNSAEKYRDVDRSIEQIGKETGADYILEATIRWDRSGDVDRFRITPKLTRTSNSYMMWSDNFDQQMVQIFEVQTEIASKIVTALGLTLLEPNRQTPDYAPTTSMAAYNYYLRGLDAMGRSARVAKLGEAIEMFDSSLALDPRFALAWAKKSTAYTQLVFGRKGGGARRDSTGLQAAEKALELDPSLPEAHIALGSHYNFLERDYERALDAFALASSEVAPNADLLQQIGVVKMRQGKWHEALSNFEQAARIDPLTVRHYYWLGTAHSYLRDFKKGREFVDRGVVLAPTDGDMVYYSLLLNLLEHGTVDSPTHSYESIVSALGAAQSSLYEMFPSTSLGVWRFVIERTDPDEMIADLRDLKDERVDYLVYMNIAQIFDLTDREDSAFIYYDSCRIRLLEDFDFSLHPNDWPIYSRLGLTYAFMGMPDSAVAAGKTAKELMPVDNCHW